MLPFPRPPWAVAALCILLTAMVGAAIQSPTAFATVETRADAGASAAGSAARTTVDVAASTEDGEARASGSASARETTPVPGWGASPRPGNGTTRPQPPTNGTPPEGEHAAPELSPREQHARGAVGHPALFRVEVANPGEVETVYLLQARASSAEWRVSFSPEAVRVAPGERAAIEGRIDARAPGAETIHVVAVGRGGNDTALVHACVDHPVYAARLCAPRHNGTENGTRDPPPPPPNGTKPPSNGTPPRNVSAPVLSPPDQRAYGRAGEPVRFGLVVENPGPMPQQVHIGSANAPAWWSVTLSPSNVTLEPGETALIEGRIDTRGGLGGEAHLRFYARGPGGESAAHVHACIHGLLQSERACAPPDNGTKNETRPPTNTTPPSNSTPPSNTTQPPPDKRCGEANGTYDCAPPNGTRSSAPASDPTPAAPAAPSQGAAGWIAVTAHWADEDTSTPVDEEA